MAMAALFEMKLFSSFFVHLLLSIIHLLDGFFFFLGLWPFFILIKVQLISNDHIYNFVNSSNDCVSIRAEVFIWEVYIAVLILLLKFFVLVAHYYESLNLGAILDHWEQELGPITIGYNEV